MLFFQQSRCGTASALAITYFYNYCNTRFDSIPVKVICANVPKDHYVKVLQKYITGHLLVTVAKRSITLNDPYMIPDPTYVDVSCTLWPRIIVSNCNGNTSNKYVYTVIIFVTKTEAKADWSKMTFDPTLDQVICATLPDDHCVKRPWKYINKCGYTLGRINDWC